MSKKYVKMNDNSSHLSLGNFFDTIKKESNSKTAAIQSEIFCIIFDIKDINETTVNNYCTGYRAINSNYKEKYIKLKIKYERDNKIFKNIMLEILSILDGHLYIESEISFDEFLHIFNNHKKIINICNDLYNISKNDLSVDKSFSDVLYNYLKKNNLYKFIVEVLFFIILDKKQPVYMGDEILDTIQNAIYKTGISANDVKEFLDIKLVEGAWTIRAISQLAKKANPYACIEMGGLEFYGQITGNPRYIESYKYYKTASEKDHPVATWFIGYMHYNGYVGNKTKEDYKIAWKQFIKAEELECIATINSIGLAYLEGHVPHIWKVDENKAIEYFTKAAEKNYVYAFNNLGCIYEKKGDFKRAFDFYIKSADLGQSWAANKVGEFYRNGKGINKDEKKAFEYYKVSSEASIYEICLWSKYNLAKYFYKKRKCECWNRKRHRFSKKTIWRGIEWRNKRG